MRNCRAETVKYRAYLILRRASGRKKKVKAVCFQVVRTVLLGALILFAVVMMNRLITYIGQSSYLAVTNVRVEGCQKISPQDLLAMAEIPANANLVGVQLKDLSQRLKENPWVKDVTVRRVFPRGLAIKVEEREPAALLADKKLFLVDKEGVVFKEVAKNDPINLPVITGFSLRAEEVGLLNEVFELLRTGENTGILPQDSISEIHVEKDYGLTLYTVGDALPIRMGFCDYRKKLSLLASIQNDLQTRNVRPEAVQLLSIDVAHVKAASSS